MVITILMQIGIVIAKKKHKKHYLEEQAGKYCRLCGPSGPCDLRKIGACQHDAAAFAAEVGGLTYICRSRALRRQAVSSVAALQMRVHVYRAKNRSTDSTDPRRPRRALRPVGSCLVWNLGAVVVGWS